MKRALACASLILGAVAAQADAIKPATLDLVCTSTARSEVFRVTSSSEGAVVTVDGETVLEREQLVGGTEGGDPYLQAVGGGYNITIEGGDFKEAFNKSSTIPDGEANAVIMAFSSDASVEATCRGSFSFAQ